jgi:hypothetical protein
MGGFLSGRYGGAPTAEGCGSLVLNINELMRPIAAARRRDAEGPPAVGHRVRWTRQGEAEPWAEVDVAVLAQPTRAEAVLRFDIAHLSRSTGPQVQHVEIAAAPCPFGGQRWYWVCPQTGRWAQKLYLPNGGRRFLSRQAYGLMWRSQRVTALERSHARLARIARRLGWEYDSPDDGPPPKPKWMRWRTYDRLVAEWDAAVALHRALWLGGAARLLRRRAAVPPRHQRLDF